MTALDQDKRKSKLRWFRFSLRTLFVLVTVSCVWLGYHLNWIRERQAFIAEMESLKGRELACVLLFDNNLLAYYRNATPGTEYDYMKTTFSLSLWLLGEPRVAIIYVSDKADASVTSRANRFFPEADVATTSNEPDQIRSFHSIR
jgi:hypothetical protein